MVHEPADMLHVIWTENCLHAELHLERLDPIAAQVW